MNPKNRPRRKAKRRYLANHLARANGCPSAALMAYKRRNWVKLYTVRGRLAWECNVHFFEHNFEQVRT